LYDLFAVAAKVCAYILFVTAMTQSGHQGSACLEILYQILPALALALAPFAAQAQAKVQPANGGNQTVVLSGPVNQMYPASVFG
jgi:hypothetical protein